MSRSAEAKRSYGKVVPIDGASISAAAWGVWCALSTFAQWETEKGQPIRNKPDSCIPRVEVIAQRAHTSESTVKRALRELEQAGYIRTNDRYGLRNKGKKGEQRSNSYDLYPRGNAPVVITDEERAERGKQIAEFRQRMGWDTPPTSPEKIVKIP